jgi:hypothetical protein
MRDGAISIADKKARATRGSGSGSGSYSGGARIGSVIMGRGSSAGSYGSMVRGEGGERRERRMRDDGAGRLLDGCLDPV